MMRPHAARWTAGLAALLAAAATWALSPKDFSYHARIELQEAGALYRVTLSRDVYRGVDDPTAVDLRVYNGGGEIVPYSIESRRDAPPDAGAPLALRVFALPPAAGAGAGAAARAWQVRTDRDGAVLQVEVRGTAGATEAAGGSEYLLDASNAKEPLHALVVALTAGGDFATRARLEASEDLASWRTIASAVPFLRLSRDGELLERKRIEFAAQRARYYRLVLPGLPDGTRVESAAGETGTVAPEGARQWESVPPLPPDPASGSVAAASGRGEDRPRDVLFDSQAHFPVDRLRLDLPEPNTIAMVQVFARDFPQQPWRPVTQATIYRLNVNGGEVASAPLAIATDTSRFWMLRVDPRGGGLGAGEPRLLLGWRAQDLLFAARGEPPFEIAFGSPGARPGAIPIEQLLLDGKAMPVPTVVTSGTSQGPLPPAGRATLQAPVPAVVLRVQADGTSGWDTLEQAALWSLLVGGVAALGWMAWALYRRMKADGAGG
jgi:hypothetical protein